MSGQHRILVIDDNASIHEDFRKILCPQAGPSAFDLAEASYFGEHKPAAVPQDFEIDSAFQGQEGLEKVRQAVAKGQPYALAFVDGRMPPGWDGVETIVNLWQTYPDLQIVICTAYSDYSWDEIVKKVGRTDSLVLLKKPFDTVEVLQLAHAFTKRWARNQQSKSQIESLNRMVSEHAVELQKTREALQKANQQLQSLEQSDEEGGAVASLRKTQNEFLASVTTQMQTPMKGVMSMNELLLHTPLNKAQRECAQAIRVNGESVTGILNDILDYSKIEQGTLVLESQPFDLHESVVGALQVLNEHAEKKGLQLTAFVEDGLPHSCQGDARRFRQVLINLVENAIRFTFSGSIQVRLSRAFGPENRIPIRVEVIDTGTGIIPEVQAKLFRPFVQVEGSAIRKYAGSGLGLAIAKGLVELMHGGIGVQTEPGKGSRFWFTVEFEQQAGSSPELQKEVA